MAGKGMTLNIKPEQVMGTEIRRTKGGYNSASMAIKVGENEYMHIGYEWQGDSVTDIAMDFMGFMSSNKEEIATAIETHKEAYGEYSAKKGKKGKMPPWMEDEEDEDMMDDEKKSKKTDKKSKKSKK